MKKYNYEVIQNSTLYQQFFDEETNGNSNLIHKNNRPVFKGFHYFRPDYLCGLQPTANHVIARLQNSSEIKGILGVLAFDKYEVCGQPFVGINYLDIRKDVQDNDCIQKGLVGILNDVLDESDVLVNSRLTKEEVGQNEMIASIITTCPFYETEEKYCVETVNSSSKKVLKHI